MTETRAAGAAHATAPAQLRTPKPVTATAAVQPVPGAPQPTPAAVRRVWAPATRRPVSAVVASAPLILSLSVSPAVVRSGSVVHASVRTTPGVVSVTAYAAGQSIAVPRVGSGAFAGSTTIPVLPPFVHGTFGVTFRALDARGAMTQASTSVTVP